MTKEETIQILTILKTNYPHYYKGWDKKLAENFVMLWSEAFKDDDVRLVVEAVKRIIYTDDREFPPNIAIVKKEMFKNVKSYQIDKSKAWEMVVRGSKCDFSASLRNFNTFPENIQKAVGSPSFMVEIGYSDRNALQFKRKEFESNLEHILEDEQEKFMCGRINMKSLQMRNGTLQLEVQRKELLEQ